MAEGSRVGVGEELEKVRAAISVQEGLRGVLPTEQLEAALGVLRARAAELSGATLVGDGAIAQAVSGGLP